MIITIEAATPAETVLGVAGLARARVRQIRNTDPMFKMDSDGARARELSDFADLLMRVEIRAPKVAPVARCESDFEAWIARVESEIASDVDPDAYREYFKRGLTPSEAVAESREDDSSCDLALADTTTEDHRQDWLGGTRTLTLDRTALEHWRMAMSLYIKTRNRKFRGETQEQATARIGYLRELEAEIADALQSYGALPGLNGNVVVAETE